MSSYISPAPQGDPKATGAYAVAIAATAGSTNNNGDAVDSAGNVFVDRVWGNFPLQPNDQRTENQLSNFGGSTGDNGWSATTYATASRLDLASVSAYSGSNVISNKAVKTANHEIVETKYASFPAYSPAPAVYRITQASGSGAVQTYTAPNNFLKAGDVVNIAGTGLDGNSLTVASANRYTFTVAGAGTGDYINISGTARYANELSGYDGSYISGVAYITVPNVVGNTTAVALDTLKDAGYAAANITTAASATNSAKTVTAVSRTTGSTTIRFTAASNGYAVGNKVTVSGLDAEFNATWTVIAAATNTFDVTGTSTASYGASGLSGSVSAVSGTIKAQNVAAGTASVALGSAITVTPWA